MKIKFRNIKMNKSNRERLDIINEIVEDYQEQGLVLTLRQLYYQLVVRNVIPNKTAEYAKLSGLLKEGRMAGIVDWSAIEDRLRSAEKPSSWDTPAEVLDSAIDSYALPRMRGQNTYVEVWVEKDALSGVLSRVTEPFHIPIMVNRGYMSTSAAYEAFKRFNDSISTDHLGNRAEKIVILYLGDFDPSGLDMLRDIRDRMLEFFVGALSSGFRYRAILKKYNKWTHDHELPNWDEDDDLATSFSAFFDDLFQVVPVALTREQIREYDPPPNPAKISDPRANDFIAEHGSQSWEVDALRPEVLNEILTTAIEQHIDSDQYEFIVSSEDADKVKLRSLHVHLNDEEDSE